MKSLFVFILFSILVSCSNSVNPSPAPTVNHVKSGQELLIILEETHSDGCTWQLNNNFNHKVIQQEKEVWHGPTKGIYFHLRAVGLGQTELEFVKRKYTDTIDRVTYIIASDN